MIFGTYHEIYSSDPDYVAEGVANDVVQQIEKALDSQGMSRAALAEAMGVNRAYVSKILNAPPNLTIRSIAAVGIGLGIKQEPKVILDPSRWILIDAGLRPPSRSAAHESGNLALTESDELSWGNIYPLYGATSEMNVWRPRQQAVAG